jgi:hypothetical protein
MGRAAVDGLAQHESWDGAGERKPSSASAQQSGSTRRNSWVPPSPAARLLAAWQRLGAEIQTEAPAPLRTGLTQKGMCWLDSPPGRCHNFLEVRGSNQAQVTGALAAAWDLSVSSIRSTPKFLSAIHKQSRRQVPPGLILSGGEPCWWDSRVTRTKLRSTRTKLLQLSNHSLFGRTHAALPRATEVDSNAGAAIHRSVAPGESE